MNGEAPVARRGGRAGRASRIERALVVATPAAAMAAVALALRVGAGEAVLAAVVYASPRSAAGTGLAWQVVTFAEEHGSREPVSVSDVEVVARASGDEAHWRGATNEDGAAEMLLPLRSDDGLHVDVIARSRVLASGDARTPPFVESPGAGSAWARYARREGPVVLDVAVLGQRVPAGFPASIWVRAIVAATRRPLPGVSIEPVPDASFAPAVRSARTDARGWAEVTATPVGHAVTMIIEARAPDGRQGVWAGALFVSPGAPQLLARARFAPDEEPQIDIVMPTVRTTGYLEIDDAKGRAWAAVVKLAAADGGMPRATVRVPRLAPGLYWAAYASDPAGAPHLGPGTMARPFVVAPTDSAALAYGRDASECAAPLDPRDAPRTLAVCLALAAATPAPRWTALEGFSQQHARDERRRERGIHIALGAIAAAVILETILVLRAAAAARARLRAAVDEGVVPASPFTGHAWTAGIALLVAVLGFVLLAAFVVRLG
jgi:hypothetical protein